MANPNPILPPEHTRWRPGVSGNPGGKPAGARNRLQADFLKDLSEHWAEHGKDAIQRACEQNPIGYIRAVASLVPKQIEVSHPLDDYDDADLRVLLNLIRARREQRLAQTQPASVEQVR